MPNSRWVKLAFLDHLSAQWPSPYLSYIREIRDRVGLHSPPPTEKYLVFHLTQWSLASINDVIEQHSLPYVQPLTSFTREAYAFDHHHLDTIAQFRLSNAGLGNRYPRVAGAPYARMKTCPLCPCPILTETHVVFFCPAVEFLSFSQSYV